MNCGMFSHFVFGFCEFCKIDEADKHTGHRITVDKKPGFFPRRGCLDCDVWLDPVELTGDSTIK